jgi:hypothetical protein
MKYKIIEKILNNNFSNEICEKIWSNLLPPKIKYNFDNLIVISPFEIKKVSRNYHLTIKDILDLPIGKPIEIFCMDRNLFDFCIYKDRINIKMSAENFFNEGYIIKYEKTHGLIGKWKFLNFDDDYFIREFDIDLGSFWHPLFNNKVPERDADFKQKMPIKFRKKHYSELPLDTRIGWRGPCMLLEDVKKLPQILLTEKDYYR